MAVSCAAIGFLAIVYQVQALSDSAPLEPKECRLSLSALHHASVNLLCIFTTTLCAISLFRGVTKMERSVAFLLITCSWWPSGPSFAGEFDGVSRGSLTECRAPSFAMKENMIQCAAIMGAGCMFWRTRELIILRARCDLA